MISIWLLFEALWQWVGENRVHCYSFAVLQYAITALVCLGRKLGGDTLTILIPMLFLVLVLKQK